MEVEGQNDLRQKRTIDPSWGIGWLNRNDSTELSDLASFFENAAYDAS
jgi:hypothetical protein